MIENCAVQRRSSAGDRPSAKAVVPEPVNYDDGETARSAFVKIRPTRARAA
jgi:hypothetical protein